MVKTKKVRRLKKNKMTRKKKMSSEKKSEKGANNGKGFKAKKVGGKYFFKDYPDFRPNLSPRDMFKLGSFGGTYWRPIKSGVAGKELKNVHNKYPKSWWKGIPDSHFTLPFNQYNKKLNKYGVKVGTTLSFWEKKGWIKKDNPYGWVHWYCDFFLGKRTADDERQIKRWMGLASERGRFRKWLVTQILKNNGKWNDDSISPKIRQTLQHWAYKLTKADFDKEVKSRKK